MFLIKDRRLGMDNYVFLQTDPRPEGFRGDLVEGASLDYDMNQIHLWPHGELPPKPRLGRDPNQLSHYKVFRNPEELQLAGFETVDVNTPFVAYSWSEYRNRYYPVPEEYAKRMTQDEWFDFLDEADSAAKFRKRMSEPSEPLPGSNIHQIAEWVAKRHMSSHGSISQVWFLPAGAPSQEVRLLEVNSRLGSSPDKIEAIDFGLELHGVKYKLLVADITTEQIDKIKESPAKLLPNDWKLEGVVIWGRRGREI